MRGWQRRLEGIIPSKTAIGGTAGIKMATQTLAAVPKKIGEPHLLEVAALTTAIALAEAPHQERQLPMPHMY